MTRALVAGVDTNAVVNFSKRVGAQLWYSDCEGHNLWAILEIFLSRSFSGVLLIHSFFNTYRVDSNVSIILFILFDLLCPVFACT